MKQSSVLKVIDLLSFIVLTLMISTGVFLEYTLPERSRSATVWSLTRHEWGDIHLNISILFLVLMSCHLIVHIKYIKLAIGGKVQREQRYRIGLGVVGIAALIMLALAPNISPITPHQDTNKGQQHRFNK